MKFLGIAIALGLARLLIHDNALLLVLNVGFFTAGMIQLIRKELHGDAPKPVSER